MCKKCRLRYPFLIPILAVVLMLMQTFVVFAEEYEDPDNVYCDDNEEYTPREQAGSGGWRYSYESSEGLTTNYTTYDMSGMTLVDTVDIVDSGRNGSLPRTGVEGTVSIMLIVAIVAIIGVIFLYISGRKKKSAQIFSLFLVCTLLIQTFPAAAVSNVKITATDTSRQVTGGRLRQFSGVIYKTGFLVTFHQFDTEHGEGWMFSNAVTPPEDGTYHFPYIKPSSTPGRVVIKNHMEMTVPGGQLIDNSGIEGWTHIDMETNFRTIREDIYKNGGAIVWADDYVDRAYSYQSFDDGRPFYYWGRGAIDDDEVLAMAVSRYFTKNANTTSDRSNLIYEDSDLLRDHDHRCGSYEMYTETGHRWDSLGVLEPYLEDCMVDTIDKFNIVFNTVDGGTAINALHNYGIAMQYSDETANGLIVIVPFCIMGLSDDASVSCVISAIDANGIQEIVNEELNRLNAESGSDFHMSNGNDDDGHFYWYTERSRIPSLFNIGKSGVRSDIVFNQLFYTRPVILGDLITESVDGELMEDIYSRYRNNQEAAERAGRTPMGIGFYSGLIKGFPPPATDVPQQPTEVALDGDLVLFDYNLNYIFNKGIASATQTNVPIAILPNNWTYYATTVTCDYVTGVDENNNAVEHGSNITSYENKSYDIAVDREVIVAGSTIVAQNSGKNLIFDNPSYTAFGGWADTVVVNVKNGSYATADALGYFEDNDGHVFLGNVSGNSVPDAAIRSQSNGNASVDYAWNLSRAVFGDARTLSGISEVRNTGYINYAVGTLGNDFGIVPAHITTVTHGGLRNSLAGFDGSYSVEQFGFKFYFSKTGNNQAIHGHTGVHEDRHYDSGTAETVSFISTIADTSHIEAHPTYCYVTISEYIYKYQSGDMPDGKNDESGTVYVVNGNANEEYKIGFVIDPSVKLQFYPEVPMIMYENAPIQSRVVNTIGENQRTSYSSMLLGVRMIHDNGNVVEGEVFSDTMTSGTGTGSGGSGAVVYAGSDITLNADINAKLQLFGYALDLVDSDIDGKGTTATNGITVGLNSYTNYSGIVRSGDNVYTAWGNSGSHTALFNRFKSWGTALLKEENLTVEVALEVGNKSYEDMNATIGAFYPRTTVWHDAVETGDKDGGVFSIEIKNGELQHTRGYNALMQQIADDYGVSTAKAAEIFETSALYTSITSAIESSKSDVNSSREQGDLLGSDGHWYDEQVSTFVIRRYYCDPVALGGVTVTDKIDYSSAPTSGKVDAKWYLTLYLNMDTNGNVCRPSDIGSIRANSYNTQTQNDVMLWNVHVENRSNNKPADFSITSQTTNSTNR